MLKSRFIQSIYFVGEILIEYVFFRWSRFPRKSKSPVWTCCFSTSHPSALTTSTGPNLRLSLPAKSFSFMTSRTRSPVRFRLQTFSPHFLYPLASRKAGYLHARAYPGDDLKRERFHGPHPHHLGLLLAVGHCILFHFKRLSCAAITRRSGPSSHRHQKTEMKIAC